MASITDATVNKPYVIDVAPGIYAEPAGIDLKSYVTIDGAGIDLTTISCECFAPVDPLSRVNSSPGAVFRAKGTSTLATISNLTVSNVGWGPWANGIEAVNVSGGMITLRDVVVSASLGETVSAGIYAYASRYTLERVSSVGTADPGAIGSVSAGLYMTNGSTVTVADSTLRGGGADTRTVGAHIQGSYGTFEDSKIYSSSSASYGIYQLPIANGDTNTLVIQSDVWGVSGAASVAANSSIRFFVGTVAGAVSGAGTKHCVGVADAGTFVERNATCG